MPEVRIDPLSGQRVFVATEAGVPPVVLPAEPVPEFEPFLEPLAELELVDPIPDAEFDDDVPDDVRE